MACAKSLTSLPRLIALQDKSRDHVASPLFRVVQDVSRPQTAHVRAIVSRQGLHFGAHPQVEDSWYERRSAQRCFRHHEHLRTQILHMHLDTSSCRVVVVKQKASLSVRCAEKEDSCLVLRADGIL